MKTSKKSLVSSSKNDDDDDDCNGIVNTMTSPSLGLEEVAVQNTGDRKSKKRRRRRHWDENDSTTKIKKTSTATSAAAASTSISTSTSSAVIRRGSSKGCQQQQSRIAKRSCKRNDEKENIVYLLFIPKDIWIDYIIPCLFDNGMSNNYNTNMLDSPSATRSTLFVGAHPSPSSSISSLFTANVGLYTHNRYFGRLHLTNSNSNLSLGNSSDSTHGYHNPFSDILSLSLVCKSLSDVVRSSTNIFVTIHPDQKFSSNIVESSKPATDNNFLADFSLSSQSSSASSSKSKVFISHDIVDEQINSRSSSTQRRQPKKATAISKKGSLEDCDNVLSKQAIVETRKWKRVEGFKFRPTWWSPLGLTYDEAIDAVYNPDSAGSSDSSAASPSASNLDRVPAQLLKSKLIQIDISGIGATRFDLNACNEMKIKTLHLWGSSDRETICVQLPDIEKISSLASLETLIFERCHFHDDIESFPKGLKKLFVRNSTKISNAVDEPICIKKLPPNLEVLDINNQIQILDDKNDRYPSTLKVLRICCDNMELQSVLPQGIPNTVEELYLKGLSMDQPLLRFSESVRELCVIRCSLDESLTNLPANLQRLLIDNCDRIVHLSLPANLELLKVRKNMLLQTIMFASTNHLKSFEVFDCPSLENSSSFTNPKNLQSLILSSDFYWLTYTSTIDVSSLGKLTELVIEGRDSLMKIESFPDSLKLIRLENINELKDLPKKVPDGLIGFHIRNCRRVTELPRLTNSLKHLSIEKVPLHQCPYFPNSLETLVISNCTLIKIIKKFPNNLRYLELSSMIQIETLPDFPKALRHLSIERCNNLLIDFRWNIDNLESLHLRENSLMSSIIPSFPPKLKSLVLISSGSEVSRIIALPRQLPDTLQKFVVRGHSEIVKFPSIPPNLIHLEIVGCKHLKSLGSKLNRQPDERNVFSMPLPNTLKILIIKNCQNLMDIENIPTGLKALHVSGSDVRIPVLPKSIEILSIDPIAGWNDERDLLDELFNMNNDDEENSDDDDDDDDDNDNDDESDSNSEDDDDMDGEDDFSNSESDEEDFRHMFGFHRFLHLGDDNMSDDEEDNDDNIHDDEDSNLDSDAEAAFVARSIIRFAPTTIFHGLVSDDDGNHDDDDSDNDD